jgi:ABC-type Fe3+/spermidine/putrescine transport system ATPase subunit
VTLEATLAFRSGALEVEVELGASARGLVLVGPNGAGKTSTLLALLGVRPSRGRVIVGGEALHELPVEERRLAWVPQSYALFPHLTAEENVRFALAARPRRERRARARELLEQLGVGHVAARRPAELSGGERQRVALARALGVDPRALLLDEPLAALDVENRAAVRGFLAAELAALGRPWILVTHDVADVRALGAPVAVLERGRVVQRGAAEELARAPATPFVARLFSG